MKKITLLFLLLGTTLFSQNKFEKGYIIYVNGNKIDCFIKNMGSIDTPKNITYKIDINSKIITTKVKNIKEFSIINNIKYIRAIVNIDKSSSNTERLSNSRISDFKRESLLLKVLTEGSANLYSYREGSFLRFFYKKKAQIEPLEYKLYKTNNNRIGKNKNYLLQLKKQFKCDPIFNNTIKYTEKNLVKFFNKYNTCKGDRTVVNFKNIKKGDFNLYGKLSLGNPSLTVKNDTRLFNANFDRMLIFKFGVEFEHIFSFNNKKWAVFIEPTFNKYNNNTENELDTFFSTVDKSSIEYTSIEIPLAIRHYMFINKKNSVFLNSGLVLDTPISSSNFKRSRLSQGIATIDDNLELSSNLSFFLGVGFSFNKKINIELRFNSKKDVLTNFISWGSNYSNPMSISIGYNFL